MADKSGEKVQKFIEYAFGYTAISKLLKGVLTYGRVAQGLKDTWLAGISPKDVPRFAQMNSNVNLDGIVEKEHVAKLVETAGLSSPYGFSSRALFRKQSGPTAGSTIRGDFDFYFKNRIGYEGNGRIVFASAGIMVAAQLGFEKHVLVVANLHNMVVPKINGLYDSFQSEYERCADPAIVKAWAEGELVKTRQIIADGGEIHNQAAYLRGLNYMVEIGTYFSKYTMDGNTAKMPGFKPSKEGEKQI